MSRAEIDAVLDEFHAAAARADEAALFARFAGDGVFLGTDATERWPAPSFRDYVHARFANGTGWKMTSVRRDVIVRGDVAWFDEDVVNAKYGALRGSGVVVREAHGAWRIAQYNLAVTVPNERFDAVHEAITANA